MRLLILAAILVLMQATTVEAEPVQLIGSGVNQSCGSWLEARKKNSWDAVAMQQWSLGYLSGAAVFSESLNPLEGVDADAVWYWLDNYCRNHPLMSFSKDALSAYVDEHPH